MRHALIPLLWLLPALAGPQEAVTRPHLDQGLAPRSVALGGQTFVNEGLVGAGALPAETLDFLGDTLGSFSSLKIAPGSWKRVGAAYEGVLWTLPDRGRNDPAANLFYDYPARLTKLRLRFTPADGKLTLTPDGGLELKDFDGRPFTGADPGAGLVTQRGVVLPAPASGVGAGKVALDAEALAFASDGGFYVGDEYTANVYRFDRAGRLTGVLTPPPAIAPTTDGKPDFGSLKPPQTGRRNNQGLEGVSLSPDGRTLIVALQSALIQDTAKGSAAGRSNTRVLVYDVSREATPKTPVGHYLVQLPVYTEAGDGAAPDKTAAQSEIQALDDHRLMMLSRDGAGRGAGGTIVYKSVLLVDLAGATNLAGTPYETTAASVLADAKSTAFKPGLVPAQQAELVNLLNPAALARFGLTLSEGPGQLSEKWEAMDLVPTLERPGDYFLLVGNDNDFIARHCRMSGQACDSQIDNASRVLVYRLSLPLRP